MRKLLLIQLIVPEFFIGQTAMALPSMECQAQFHESKSLRDQLDSTPHLQYDYGMRSQVLSVWALEAISKMRDPSKQIGPQAETIYNAISPFKGAFLGIGFNRGKEISPEFVAESLNLLYEYHSIDDIQFALQGMLLQSRFTARGVITALRDISN